MSNTNNANEPSKVTGNVKSLVGNGELLHLILHPLRSLSPRSQPRSLLVRLDGTHSVALLTLRVGNTTGYTDLANQGKQRRTGI
jgi:hypothetical protein